MNAFFANSLLQNGNHNISNYQFQLMQQYQNMLAKSGNQFNNINFAGNFMPMQPFGDMGNNMFNGSPIFPNANGFGSGMNMNGVNMFSANNNSSPLGTLVHQPQGFQANPTSHVPSVQVQRQFLPTISSSLPLKHEIRTEIDSKPILDTTQRIESRAKEIVRGGAEARIVADSKRMKLRLHDKDGDYEPSRFPRVQGFTLLQPKEIHTDLVLIHKAIGRTDSDSECSFDSDDILSSSYPVRPRKWSLRQMNNRQAQKLALLPNSSQTSSKMDAKSVDEAFAYLHALESTYPQLWKTEKERETLELMCESYRDTIANNMSKFNVRKCSHINYLKLLQLSLNSRLRHNCLQRRNNMLTADIVNAIVHFHEAIDRLGAATKILDELNTNMKSENVEACKLSKKPASKKAKKASPSDQPSSSGSTTLSRYACHTAKLSIQTESNDEPIILLIFVGQQIWTPFGEAEVDGLEPVAEMVRLKLPFGFMFSTYSSIINWKLEAFARYKAASSNGSLSGGNEENAKQKSEFEPVEVPFTLDELSPSSILKSWRSYKEFPFVRSVAAFNKMKAITKKFNLIDELGSVEDKSASENDTLNEDENSSNASNIEEILLSMEKDTLQSQSILTDNLRQIHQFKNDTVHSYIDFLHENREISPKDFMLACAPLEEVLADQRQLKVVDGGIFSKGVSLSEIVSTAASLPELGGRRTVCDLKEQLRVVEESIDSKRYETMSAIDELVGASLLATESRLRDFTRRVLIRNNEALRDIVAQKHAVSSDGEQTNSAQDDVATGRNSRRKSSGKSTTESLKASQKEVELQAETCQSNQNRNSKRKSQPEIAEPSIASTRRSRSGATSTKDDELPSFSAKKSKR